MVRARWRCNTTMCNTMCMQAKPPYLGCSLACLSLHRGQMHPRLSHPRRFECWQLKLNFYILGEGPHPTNVLDTSFLDLKRETEEVCDSIKFGIFFSCPSSIFTRYFLFRRRFERWSWKGESDIGTRLWSWLWLRATGWQRQGRCAPATRGRGGVRQQTPPTSSLLQTATATAAPIILQQLKKRPGLQVPPWLGVDHSQ